MDKARASVLEMATESLNAIRVRPCVLIPPDPSVRFRIFFLVASTYVPQTAKNPKIGKIESKIRAFVYRKPRNPYLLKKY